MYADLQGLSSVRMRATGENMSLAPKSCSTKGRNRKFISIAPLVPRRDRGRTFYTARESLCNDARKVTNEKCGPIFGETGSFSRALRFPLRGPAKINVLSSWVLQWRPSTDEDRMRSSPKDTSETGARPQNATDHSATQKTVKQIPSCNSKHS